MSFVLPHVDVIRQRYREVQTLYKAGYSKKDYDEFKELIYEILLDELDNAACYGETWVNFSVQNDMIKNETCRELIIKDFTDKGYEIGIIEKEEDFIVCFSNIH